MNLSLRTSNQITNTTMMNLGLKETTLKDIILKFTQKIVHTQVCFDQTNDGNKQRTASDISCFRSYLSVIEPKLNPIIEKYGKVKKIKINDERITDIVKEMEIYCEDLMNSLMDNKPELKNNLLTLEKTYNSIKNFRKGLRWNKLNNSLVNLVNKLNQSALNIYLKCLDDTENKSLCKQSGWLTGQLDYLWLDLKKDNGLLDLTVPKKKEKKIIRSIIDEYIKKCVNHYESKNQPIPDCIYNREKSLMKVAEINGY